jgi:hypothetical protein
MSPVHVINYYDIFYLVLLNINNYDEIKNLLPGYLKWILIYRTVIVFISDF